MFDPGDYCDSDDDNVKLLLHEMLGDDLMHAMLGGGEPSTPTNLLSSSNADNNDETSDEDEGEDDEEDCLGIEEYRKRIQQKNCGDATMSNGVTQGSAYKDSDDDKSSDVDGDDDDKKYEKSDKEFSEARDAYMNSLTYGPDAPTKKDAGSFLNKQEIKDWRQEIGEIFPQVYEKDYEMFGKDGGGGPHGFGTKLRTTEECEISVYATIVGSRFYDEGTHRNRKYKLPFYIVKIKGDSAEELMKIDMCDAHHNYRTGWGDGEDDAIDEDVKNMLPRQVKDDSNDEWQRLEARHQQIMAGLGKWNKDAHGSVAQAFWNNMFTPDEVKEFNCGDRLIVPSEYKAPSSFGHSNLKERQLSMSIVNEGCNGIILENQRGTKFIAIDVYGPSDYDGTPVINVQFTISYEKDCAELFLRGEKIKTTYGVFRAGHECDSKALARNVSRERFERRLVWNIAL
jgi:hypothetical protein